MRSALILALVFCASTSLAQVPPPGATTCSGCHGAGSDLPLDGWSAEEIIAAMAGFREAESPATLMPRLVAGFSEDEVAAIAEWIAAGGMQNDAR